MKYIKTFESSNMFYKKDRPEFKTGVHDGDIVKLDRDYLKTLDSIDWDYDLDGNPMKHGFTEEELNKEYVLVNFDFNYGYALRNINSTMRDFLGWVPPKFIRHLNELELNMKKYNL